MANVARESQRRSLTALGQKRKLREGSRVSGGREELALPAHSPLTVSPLSSSQQSFLSKLSGPCDWAPLHH